MRETTPQVFLIARPSLIEDQVAEYLDAIGAQEWYRRVFGAAVDAGVALNDPEALIEIAGRLCYRSWVPGLNANVVKIREDSAVYLENILASGHGSVLEHAQFTFIFHNVSRVFTAEMNRHRAGCAISEQSLRFVRLTDIPFWFPEWTEAPEHDDLMEEARDLLAAMEKWQLRAAEHFDLDGDKTPFAKKKFYTSFMRRLAPLGLSTEEVWSGNIRAIRHVISMRSAEGAEEEIRMVADQLAGIMQGELPNLFGDFVLTESGAWVTKNWKV